MLAVGVNISPAIVPLTIVVGPPVVYDSSIILPVWRNVISSLALGAAVDVAAVDVAAVAAFDFVVAQLQRWVVVG